MAGTRTTEVNYEIIDRCISNISQSVNDYHIQIDMGRLQLVMDSSTGDYASELKQASKEVKEAYQIIVDLMYESNEMLRMAKKLFADMDSETADEMEEN